MLQNNGFLWKDCYKKVERKEQKKKKTTTLEAKEYRKLVYSQLFDWGRMEEIQKRWSWKYCFFCAYEIVRYLQVTEMLDRIIPVI